jgi:hypothetical protein
MQFNAELTDTFCGEANYSWVKRVTFEAPSNAKTSLLVRRAKRALGLMGRHYVHDYGEEVKLTFGRDCIVAFIFPDLSAREEELMAYAKQQFGQYDNTY